VKPNSTCDRRGAALASSASEGAGPASRFICYAHDLGCWLAAGLSQSHPGVLAPCVSLATTLQVDTEASVPQTKFQGSTHLAARLAAR